MNARLKTLIARYGIEAHKVAGLLDLFGGDEDFIADFLERTKATEDEADRQGVAYKGANMAKKLDSHTEAAYDLCDVADWIARHRGDTIARAEVGTAIGALLTRYPGAANVLDTTDATVYKAAFKTAQAMKQAPTTTAKAQPTQPDAYAQAFGADPPRQHPAATKPDQPPRDLFAALIRGE